MYINIDSDYIFVIPVAIKDFYKIVSVRHFNCTIKIDGAEGCGSFLEIGS